MFRNAVTRVLQQAKAVKTATSTRPLSATVPPPSTPTWDGLPPSAPVLPPSKPASDGLSLEVTRVYPPLPANFCTSILEPIVQIPDFEDFPLPDTEVKPTKELVQSPTKPPVKEVVASSPSTTRTEVIRLPKMSAAILPEVPQFPIVKDTIPDPPTKATIAVPSKHSKQVCEAVKVKTVAKTEQVATSLTLTAVTKVQKPWPFGLPTFLRPQEGTTYFEMYAGQSSTAAAPKTVGFLQSLLYGVPESILEGKKLKIVVQKDGKGDDKS